MEHRTLYRKKDQSLPELAQTTRRLTRQTFPEATRETLAKNHFIDALPDADVRWRIQQTRPKSLKDALTTAVELEAFQTANIQRSQANRVVVPHAQTAAAASPEDKKYVPGHLEKKLDTMAKLLQSLVSSLTNPKRPSREQTNPARCWTCGKPGHLQRDCPKSVGASAE